MNYPAKIILFGEYGVLLEAQALSIPYARFGGNLRVLDESLHHFSEGEQRSSEELKSMCGFLQNHPEKYRFLQLRLFGEEVQKGLIFDSTIPYGFGLGSSGALTAALYDRYVSNSQPLDFLTLKSRLAAMESFFHGTSSGIDPLTSYLKKAVLFGNNPSVATAVDLMPFFSSHFLYLLDIPSTGHTAELVTKFLHDCEEPSYRRKIENEYVPIVNQTIAVAISENCEPLENCLIKYADFQLTHFTGMIPQMMVKHAKYGLESGDFYLKLCGSGGGGQMLAITSHPSRAERYFNLNQLTYTLIIPDTNLKTNHTTNVPLNSITS